MFSRLIVICLLFCLLAHSSVVVQAATPDTITGTLVGRVFDASTPCVVPNCPLLFGALVQVRNDDKGYIRSVKTDIDGAYRLEFIEPGKYTITGKLAGYNDDTIRDFVIRLDKPTEILPPPLRLAKVGLTPPPVIQVNPESVVNTVDATRRGAVDTATLTTLPLNGVRTFDDFAKLIPGVAPPPATSGVAGPGVGPGVGTAGQFTVNGLRSRSNNFTVDGSDNNDPDIGVRRQGYVALVPQSIESVKEVSITTSLADAQAGRNFGAQVNAISRSGSNEFHGTLYDFSRSSSFAARNFFDTGFGGKDSFTDNQYGFALGGPIRADRTHFFISYEGQSLNREQENHFATPQLSERPAPDPSVPEAQATIGLFPLPNNPAGPYGANNFTQILPAGGHGNVASVKLDHRIADNQSLTIRYNFTDDHSIIPSVNGAINGSVSPRTRTQNISLFHIAQLGPTLANEARFSFGRTRLRFDEVPGSPFIFQSTPVVDRNGDGIPDTGRTGPIGELDLMPFSPIGVDVYHFPQARVNNTFQWADTLSKTFVGHSLKFGADIRRNQFNSRLDRNFRPLILFNSFRNTNPAVTDDNGNPVPFITGLDLLGFGQPTAVIQTLATGAADSTIGLRFTETSYFAQDSWNARRGLHFDLGLRYEYTTVPYDAKNRIENSFKPITFTPNDETRFPSQCGDPKCLAVKNVLANFAAADAALNQVIGGRTQIYDPDRNNFAPRIGIAFDPKGDGKLAIRAGYGIYYDQILGSVASESRNVFPNFVPLVIGPSFAGGAQGFLPGPAFVVQRDINGVIALRLINPATINQFGGPPALLQEALGVILNQNSNTITGAPSGNGLAFTLPQKHLPTPYAQQFSLTIERELWRDYLLSVGYVGTRGTELTRFLTPNLGPVETTFVDTDLFLSSQAPKGGRPNGRLGAYSIFENSANSGYNALQVSLTKRFSLNYQFAVSYTYSHALDDVSDVFDMAGAYALPQDNFNLRAERGSANFDLRHRLTVNGIWDLPFARSDRVLGGWSLTGTLTLQGGQPYTVNSSVDVNQDGNLTDRLNTTNGLLAINQGPSRLALATGATFDQLLAPAGQDGLVGRNTFRGPGFFNVDLALVKRITFSERVKLSFRTEVFNLFNRADFGLPVRILEGPGFGQSVNTVQDALRVQFALKLTF